MSSGVEFDEGGYNGASYPRQYATQTQKSTPIYAAFIRWGFAKDDASASRLSVKMSLVLMVIAGIVVYVFVIRDSTVAPADDRYKIGDVAR